MNIRKLYIVFVLLVWFISPFFSQSIQTISLNNPKSLSLEKDWAFFPYDSLKCT